jgi:MerR family copper efflux transcriptional regulator
MSRAAAQRVPNDAPETMRIGEFARRGGISRDTVRFYEKAGLLSPRVAMNGYRLFDASQLELLRSIRIAQVLGFTLSEIRKQIGRWDDQTPAMRARFLSDKLELIDARITELTEMRAHLVDKIAWIRKGKKGIPEKLAAASRARRGAPIRASS